jgi:hypothetical protein
MYESDPNAGRKPRQAEAPSYEPTRRPRLRLVEMLAPPPLPARSMDETDGFGNAPEDGLRMLAALETLGSLEPDFCDDFASEASVTIIECATSDAERSPVDASLSSLLDAAHERLDGADADGLYQTFIDEAVVEIVEVVDVSAVAAEPAHGEVEDASPPATPKGERRRATSRFFNALSGR